MFVSICVRVCVCVCVFVFCLIIDATIATSRTQIWVRLVMVKQSVAHWKHWRLGSLYSKTKNPHANREQNGEADGIGSASLCLTRVPTPHRVRFPFPAVANSFRFRFSPTPRSPDNALQLLRNKHILVLS